MKIDDSYVNLKKLIGMLRLCLSKVGNIQSAVFVEVNMLEEIIMDCILESRGLCKNDFKFSRLLFKVKSIITAIVFITLFFSSISSISYASDYVQQPSLPKTIEQKLATGSSVFKKSYNVVYQFLNDHEYLFTPLSGSVAGGRICGSWCAAAGGVAGTIDEVLVYFGYTSKRYLTWGIFGMATGHAISPSLTSDIAGVAFGILLPTGVLNNHKEMAAPVVSAIAGNTMAGTPGMVAGGVAGIFDEVLLRYGAIDKHYLTFAYTGHAVTNLLGLNPLMSEILGTLLGVIAANYEEGIVANLLAPVNAVNSLYTVYGKFIPEDQLNTHIERQAIALIGAQFLTQFLSLKISNYNQGITNSFEHLDDPNGQAWNNFRSKFINFAIFLFPYAIGQVFSNSIDDYFCKKLHFVLEDKIRAELFTGETALRLSHDPNTTMLMDNLSSDISTIVDSGSGLVSEAISTSINGAYGVGVIIVSSPDILVYSALYDKANDFVSGYLATQRRFYGQKIRALDSQLVTTVKHDVENIRTITERNGVAVTRSKVQQLSADMREYEGAQKLWGIANSIWWSISGAANTMFRYYLLGNEINKGRIPFEKRTEAQTASWQVSNLLSWAGRNAQTTSYIGQSLDRVVILEGKIRTQSNAVDEIKRVNQEGNQLILQDLEVGIEDRMLVAIKDLKLEMGKIYAITGESGCGKTSLLSKIRGIKENGVYGKGYIYYPLINEKEPRIVMLSQQDYFPLDSSLYEIISYPDKIPSDHKLNDKKREEIKLLLREIGFYAFSATVAQDKHKKGKDTKPLSLDSKKDWYTYLSGGEKKKIIIISAIIKKPDILILDELFNGIDIRSLGIIQQMLKTYLPNTLILIVDHHAKDNNYNSFYDREIKFFDKGVVLQEISIRAQ